MYLLVISGMKDDFDKNIFIMVMIVLLHLSTKFFVLVILQNNFLYNQIATGFGLSYGPMLLISFYSAKHKKISGTAKLLHLLPFAAFSLVYIFLVAGILANKVASSFIFSYTEYYVLLVVTSLIIYPGYVLKELQQAKEKNNKAFWLIKRVAFIMIAAISLAIFLKVARYYFILLPDVDIRLFTYIIFSIIPILVLQYRMSTRPIINYTIVTENTIVPQKAEPAVINTENTKETEVATANTAPNKREKRYNKSALNIDAMQAYEKQLLAFMAKTKIYLEPELSLEMLATKTNIPKHHITQLLNEHIKKNFYQFVNEYRIEEAKKRINTSKSDVPILSLAYDCGFNSKSSFNNYFKKITGLTPTEYKENKLVS
ncbi:helix-turn-helix domain-containing protein [Parafilimonas sp.]|uniref:helix-turn-helix domain-containing protein n=1 Tax=Parafilimonas sp. TaxID=1969739 RepID=UPI0039E3BDF8